MKRTVYSMDEAPAKKKPAKPEPEFKPSILDRVLPLVTVAVLLGFGLWRLKPGWAHWLFVLALLGVTAGHVVPLVKALTDTVDLEKQVAVMFLALSVLGLILGFVFS